MANKKNARKALKPRKSPVQRRSTDTVAVILEAAARVLERNGFEGFNTNVIAEKAGVSIGSLYQYFPNKDALLSGLIEREFEPLLAVGNNLAQIESCEVALREYIGASVHHQMRRPKLARLIDIAEQREAFQHQVSGTHLRLEAVMENILKLPDAPQVKDKKIASADLLAIVRSLVDAAGERGEVDTPDLRSRVEGAVWGYLHKVSKDKYRRHCSG